MMLVFFTRGCEVETDEGTRERERKEENKPFEVKNRLPPNTSTSSREKKRGGGGEGGRDYMYSSHTTTMKRGKDMRGKQRNRKEHACMGEERWERENIIRSKSCPWNNVA